jgi:IS30 family transposase
MRLAQERHA